MRFVTLAILGCSVCCTLLALTAGRYLAWPLPSYYLHITLVLALSTWLTVKRLLRIQSPERFTQTYLASIVLQLLAWVSFMGVVFYLDSPGAASNAVYFLINSLIFIAIEVALLLTRKQL